MLEWGLVNQVVPMSELRDEVRKWVDEMLALSPAALKFVKHSFNADTESIAGISAAASTCSLRPSRRWSWGCGPGPRAA